MAPYTTSIRFISYIDILTLMAEFGVEDTRMRLQEIIDRSVMGEKITVTTENGNAVIVSEEDWDSLVEAMSALALQGRTDIVGAAIGF